MAKINSTKLHNQEESEDPTPPKPKGATNKYSHYEGHDKDVYPIIYCHTHGISRKLTHRRMNCKLSSNTHTKEATLFNWMGGITITNKTKAKK